MGQNKTSIYLHQNDFLSTDKKEEIDTDLTGSFDSLLSDTKHCEHQFIPENVTENYDIYVSRRSTYFQTLFHLIKCHIGSGMFALGDVFRNHSGLLLGPLLTLFLGIVCICDNHILANCSKEIKNRRQLNFYPTFPDTMEWAFESGPKLFKTCSITIRGVVKWMTILTQLGCCIVYFIFISSSLQSLLKMLSRHGIVMDEHLIIVIIFFPVVLTTFMCNLRFLTLFSMIASVFVFCTVSLALYISSSDLPPVTPRPAIAHWSQIPLFFGTSIYCFEGIAKTLPMHGEVPVRDRQVRHCSLLILLLAVVGTLFVVIALVCFIKFVDDIAGNNFGNHQTFTFSKDYLCSEMVQLTIALGLLFSYTLQFHIALMVVWPELVRVHGPTRHLVLVELAFRLMLALCTFAAVEVLPRLGVFVSLTGAVCGTLLALLLPPLCDLALHWDHTSRPCHHFFDFFSIFASIAGFLTGSLYIIMVMTKGFPDDVPND